MVNMVCSQVRECYGVLRIFARLSLHLPDKFLQLRARSEGSPERRVVLHGRRCGAAVWREESGSRFSIASGKVDLRPNAQTLLPSRSAHALSHTTARQCQPPFSF